MRWIEHEMYLWILTCMTLLMRNLHQIFFWNGIKHRSILIKSFAENVLNILYPQGPMMAFQYDNVLLQHFQQISSAPNLGQRIA